MLGCISSSIRWRCKSPAVDLESDIPRFETQDRELDSLKDGCCSVVVDSLELEAELMAIEEVKPRSKTKVK